MTDHENNLISDLVDVIAKHVDWLDGRSFQRCAQIAVEGYFEQDDLFPVMLRDPDPEQLTPEQLGEAFAKALAKAMGVDE